MSNVVKVREPCWEMRGEKVVHRNCLASSSSTISAVDDVRCSPEMKYYTFAQVCYTNQSVYERYVRYATCV